MACPALLLPPRAADGEVCECELECWEFATPIACAGVLNLEDTAVCYRYYESSTNYHIILLQEGTEVNGVEWIELKHRAMIDGFTSSVEYVSYTEDDKILVQ